jgi:hypothetical protein
MNVNGSFFDIHKFILPEVLVHWKFVSSHVLRIRRSLSFFSSRRGFAGAWDVVAELDCADRV